MFGTPLKPLHCGEFCPARVTERAALVAKHARQSDTRQDVSFWGPKPRCSHRNHLDRTVGDPWKLQTMSPDNLPAMVDVVPYNIAIQITAGGEEDSPAGILRETMGKLDVFVSL